MGDRVAEVRTIPIVRQRCQKLTQTGRVCGRNFNADTTCPGGYLHAEAPRYPRRWPSVTLLTLGVLLLFVFLTGGLSWIAPFASGLVPSSGQPVSNGASYALSAHTQYGLYLIGACSSASSPDVVFQDRAVSVQPHWSGAGPVYNQSILDDPGSGVQRCATFTVPVSGRYLVEGVSPSTAPRSTVPPATIGIVPTADASNVIWYKVAFWDIVAISAIGLVWLLRTLRRQHRARDPFERRDTTHDPVAIHASETHRWLEEQGRV